MRFFLPRSLGKSGTCKVKHKEESTGAPTVPSGPSLTRVAAMPGQGAVCVMLLANRPDLEPAKIARRRKQMDEAIDDCLVEGYEYLIPELNLPDYDDRHVLAAAIHAQAQVILAYNHRHFPPRVLAPYGMTAQRPDDFLAAVAERFSQEVCSTLEEMRARKARPALSQAEILRRNHMG